MIPTGALVTVPPPEPAFDTDKVKVVGVADEPNQLGLVSSFGPEVIWVATGSVMTWAAVPDGGAGIDQMS